MMEIVLAPRNRATEANNTAMAGPNPRRSGAESARKGTARFLERHAMTLRVHAIRTLESDVARRLHQSGVIVRQPGLTAHTPKRQALEQAAGGKNGGVTAGLRPHESEETNLGGKKVLVFSTRS